MHRSEVQLKELVTTRQYVPTCSGPAGEITGSQSVELNPLGPVHIQLNPTEFWLVKTNASPGQGVLALICGIGGMGKTSNVSETLVLLQALLIKLKT